MRTVSILRTGTIVLFVCLLAHVPCLSAQSAEKKARVAYAAAKIALQRGDAEIALTKFEEVIEALGPLPELLYYAGEAAFQAEKLDKAKEYADRAFVIDDKEFEKTPEFQKLIELQAKLDLQQSSAGTWKEMYASVSNGTRTRVCEGNRAIRSYEVTVKAADEQSFAIFDYSEPTLSKTGCWATSLRKTVYRSVRGESRKAHYSNLNADMIRGTCFFSDSRRELQSWINDPEYPPEPMTEQTLDAADALSSLKKFAGEYTMAGIRCSPLVETAPSDFGLPLR